MVRLWPCWVLISVILTPLKCALAPCVQPADDENGDEDKHFEQDKDAEVPAHIAEACRPWEEENHLYIENHEKQGEAVESEVELAPPAGEGLEAALVDAFLNGAGHLRANLEERQHPRHHQHADRDGDSYRREDGYVAVLSEVVVEHWCQLARVSGRLLFLAVNIA